jgi:hypothetical protein
MQIMLDKGEENDWFASTFIRVFGLALRLGYGRPHLVAMAGKESDHEPPSVQVQELRHLQPAHDPGWRRLERRNRIAAAIPATADGLHCNPRGTGNSWTEDLHCLL